MTLQTSLPLLFEAPAQSLHPSLFAPPGLSKLDLCGLGYACFACYARARLALAVLDSTLEVISNGLG